MKNSRRVVITRIGVFGPIATEKAPPKLNPDREQILAKLKVRSNPKVAGHAA
jgi:hypothetical protein